MRETHRDRETERQGKWKTGRQRTKRKKDREMSIRKIKLIFPKVQNKTCCCHS